MKVQTSAGIAFEIDESPESLMKALLAHQVPVASSCNGDGICGKCKVEVIAGMENLTPPTEAEQMLKNKFRLDSHTRISCQCKAYGDVSLRTTYW